MGKPCTDCGLLLQVFLGSSSLKSFSESDVMQSVERCSMVKCSHVFKPQEQLGFVTKKWGVLSDLPRFFWFLVGSACFYYTYASRERLPFATVWDVCMSRKQNSLEWELNTYVRMKFHSQICCWQHCWDIASIQHRRLPPSDTGCCCAT